MEGTCLKDKCIFWERNGVNGCKCPFYRETIWSSSDSNQPVILEDCAPVRSLFMQMDDHNNTMGVKQLVGEIRNTLDVLKTDTQNFMLTQKNELNSLKKSTEHILFETNNKLLENGK